MYFKHNWHSDTSSIRNWQYAWGWLVVIPSFEFKYFSSRYGMKLVIDFVHYCCHSLYLAPVFAIFSYNIFYELYKYKIAKLSKNIWIWICQCSVWLSIVNSISLVERRGWLCQNGWSAKYSAWNENHMVSARTINFRHTRVYWIYWKSTLGIFFLQR